MEGHLTISFTVPLIDVNYRLENTDGSKREIFIQNLFISLTRQNNFFTFLIVPNIVPYIVPFIVPNIVPNIVPSIVPYIVPYIVPDIAPNIVPNIIPNIVPNIIPNIIPNIVPYIVPYILFLIASYLFVCLFEDILCIVKKSH